MVNAQEYIKENFLSEVEEIKINRGLKLERDINLSAYKNLKTLSMVDCGLTNFDFLNTIPNK
jgi:hypothetical protein